MRILSIADMCVALLCRMSTKEAFTAYTKGAGDMDGRTFTKILKDCKVLDSKVTAVDADLIFTKVKAKGSKKITFEQFQEALRLVAAKKGVEVESIEAKLAAGKASLQPCLSSFVLTNQVERRLNVSSIQSPFKILLHACVT